MLYRLHVLTFMLLSELWPESCADVFSAMFKMEHLLETRQRVIHDLDAYIHKEENRLRDLKIYLKMYKTEHERAMKDMTHYTGNPINAFILIKRLTSDLDDIEERINKPTDFVSVRNVTRDSSNATILYPTAVDLQGAALALKRLQKTYKLKVEDLANGVLNGVVYRQPLMASDCYKIGVIILRAKDYMNALAWQMEALRKFKLEDSIPHSFTEIDIIENIGTLYHLLSDPETALEWTVKILALDPDNELAKKNFEVYEIQIVENDREFHSEASDAKELALKTNDDKNNKTVIESDGKDGISDENKEIYRKDNTVDENKISDKEQTKIVNRANDTKSDFINTCADKKNETDVNCDTSLNEESSTNVNSTESNTNSTNYRESESFRKRLDRVIDFRKDVIMYQALCRGEYEIAPAISSRLKCYYLNDKPFLKLAPIKTEQRYIDPDVFLFHDVISDEEIAHVKEMAKPHINRALVLQAGNKPPAAVDYRISQNSWLRDAQSAVVGRLTQRISDFTGLDMKYAEPLQVANYGIGGHYSPHFDYFGKISEGKGYERIATTMFYMSDVTQGGATVFPKLGLTVFPVKGSAVLWMNLLPSGEGNQNTRHAACPVLEGSKWVANKWIKDLGQEFIKPCNLEYQREGVILQRPAPVMKTEHT